MKLKILLVFWSIVAVSLMAEIALAERLGRYGQLLEGYRKAGVSYCSDIYHEPSKWEKRSSCELKWAGTYPNCENYDFTFPISAKEFQRVSAKEFQRDISEFNQLGISLSNPTKRKIRIELRLATCQVEAGGTPVLSMRAKHFLSEHVGTSEEPIPTLEEMMEQIKKEEQ